MTQTEHKALVARYFEQVLTHGDVAALDDLLAPDFRRACSGASFSRPARRPRRPTGRPWR
jgi:ketosteroid isomerase-like protein